MFHAVFETAKNAIKKNEGRKWQMAGEKFFCPPKSPFDFFVKVFDKDFFCCKQILFVGVLNCPC
jgi:hypothetical protein